MMKNKISSTNQAKKYYVSVFDCGTYKNEKVVSRVSGSGYGTYSSINKQHIIIQVPDKRPNIRSIVVELNNNIPANHTNIQDALPDNMKNFPIMAWSLVEE